ncbi:hypothetical protein MFIFM68171_02220 [Madurella fahalii]|uniref:Secreted protein n=1 Tax=Madurella fahalii TaxID=1157608 RepID=A0ABQ0G2P8_9PEZI
MRFSSVRCRALAFVTLSAERKLVECRRLLLADEVEATAQTMAVSVVAQQWTDESKVECPITAFHENQRVSFAAMITLRLVER